MSTPTTTSAEVVVIGGGLEGCSAAWALTRRGVTDVVIVERLGGVADLGVDGKSSDDDIPATDFRLSRFAEGALLTSPHPYVGAGQVR
ncbi:hypothetical protein GCM10023201_44090 [Actinomycetospora corticicola]|uniref:Cation diffusion facilitator CzcD-associated flavoprotein CzcO n=1 Tax=Actinomycetospora corticicola TaxID=663602 RepID=A0A7Y9DVV7_9PSEU|nr:cation diffusion facilitator CzcD-associated flavoprotein CzcO [Actinomycetospora corticicola]